MKHTLVSTPSLELDATEEFAVALWGMLEQAISEVYVGECQLDPEERKRLFLLNEGLTRDVRRQALDNAIWCALKDATELSVVGDRNDPTRLSRSRALADLLAYALDGLVSEVGEEHLSGALREILNSPDADKFGWGSVVKTTLRHLGDEAGGRAALLDG